MSNALEVTASDLTPQQELFAVRCAHHGNQGLAYREAYNVGLKTAPKTVWEVASRLANDRTVAARISELRRIAADGILYDARELIKDWADIATADPNELIRHVQDSCRFCHGVDHKYQWRDTDEYLDALIVAASSDPPASPPDDIGGYGFNATDPPEHSCPQCYGEGIGRTVLADTTQLTGKARKLYKGVKVKGDGSIEVLMHDQDAARVALAKCMGLYSDGAPPLNPPKNAGRTIDANATAVDASQAYLQLMR